jgi:hypothetical protein
MISVKLTCSIKESGVEIFPEGVVPKLGNVRHVSHARMPLTGWAMSGIGDRWRHEIGRGGPEEKLELSIAPASLNEVARLAQW